MSDISLTCPSCNKIIEAPEEMAGATGECPFCDQSIIIPGKPATTTRATTPPKSQPQKKQMSGCMLAIIITSSIIAAPIIIILIIFILGVFAAAPTAVEQFKQGYSVPGILYLPQITHRQG